MRRPATRAFTLVEILMVVVILGIVAAIIVPQIGARDDLKLAAAARTLIADLSYAQSRAISSQKKQYVDFETDKYTLKSRSITGSLSAITHPINPGSYITSFASGPLAGVTIVDFSFGTESTLAFDELGSPLQYNDVTDAASAMTGPGIIRLQSGDRNLTISIEPYTGEMSVSEGTP